MCKLVNRLFDLFQQCSHLDIIGQITGETNRVSARNNTSAADGLCSFFQRRGKRAAKKSLLFTDMSSVPWCWIYILSILCVPTQNGKQQIWHANEWECRTSASFHSLDPVDNCMSRHKDGLKIVHFEIWTPVSHLFATVHDSGNPSFPSCEN